MVHAINIGYSAEYTEVVEKFSIVSTYCTSIMEGCLGSKWQVFVTFRSLYIRGTHGPYRGPRGILPDPTRAFSGFLESEFKPKLSVPKSLVTDLQQYFLVTIITGEFFKKSPVFIRQKIQNRKLLPFSKIFIRIINILFRKQRYTRNEKSVLLDPPPS